MFGQFLVGSTSRDKWQRGLILLQVGTDPDLGAALLRLKRGCHSFNDPPSSGFWGGFIFRKPFWSWEMGVYELLQLVPFCVCDTILCFYDDNQMSALGGQTSWGRELEGFPCSWFLWFPHSFTQSILLPSYLSSISDQDQDVLFNFCFYWNVSAFQCCVSLCFTMTWIGYMYPYTPSVLDLCVTLPPPVHPSKYVESRKMGRMFLFPGREERAGVENTHVDPVGEGSGWTGRSRLAHVHDPIPCTTPVAVYHGQPAGTCCGAEGAQLGALWRETSLPHSLSENSVSFRTG